MEDCSEGQKKTKGKIKADTLLDARRSTYILSPNNHTYEAGIITTPIL